MTYMNLKAAGLALLALSSLAIALPLLSTLGEGATFFVAHGAEVSDILLFAFSIYIIPPTLILASTFFIQLISPVASKVFLKLSLGTLSGLWIMSLFSTFSGFGAIAIALVVGVLVGWNYTVRSGLANLLSMAGYASPIIVIYFLVFTPVAKLLTSDIDIEYDVVSGNKTPVVFLVLDELPLAALLTPSQNIDAGRLPNFGRLEQISTWYPDTTTASTYTEKAVSAILSGRYVDDEALPVYSNFPRNLFTILASTHTIKAIETITRLCPEKLCALESNFDQTGFNAKAMWRDTWYIWLNSVAPGSLAESYLPSISHSWRDFGQLEISKSKKADNNSRRTKQKDMRSDHQLRFNSFLDGIRGGTQADLNYIHLPLPHDPWVFLPDGTNYNGVTAPGKNGLQKWDNDKYVIDQAILQFALQLEFVDKLLGDVLDVLEAEGKLNNTLLIVVSDHGIVISPDKQRRLPGVSTLADVSRVPLFIKYPGQLTGGRDERKTQTVDILPTVAEVLGLPLIEGVHGQSLVSSNWIATPRRIHEAEKTISNVEAAMDMKGAIDRYLHVIIPDKSSVESIGINSGKPFFGKHTSELKSSEGELILHLDRTEWYANVDLDSGFLPARLTGLVDGAALGTEILVALNGIMAGNSRTYDDIGRFSIMLDPRRFRNGSNELEAFQLSAGELHRVLIATNGASNWQLHKNSDGIVTVIDDKGVSYGHGDGLSGHAGFQTRDGSIDVLYGWAYDEQLEQAAKTLLLVDGENVISTGFRKQTKPPLVHHGREGIAQDLEYWFLLEIDQELKKRKSSLYILALFEDGRMFELHPN